MTSNYEGPQIACRPGGHPALACAFNGLVYHYSFVDRPQYQILYAKKPKANQTRSQHAPLPELTELVQAD